MKEIKEKLLEKEQEELKIKEKLENIQKRSRYGELVKTMCLPTVSQQKKEQMEKLRQTIKHEVRENKIEEVKK